MTIAEVKQYIGIQDTDNDTLLTELLTNAKSYVENFTGRKLSTQSVTKYLTPTEELTLLRDNPINSITSVEYRLEYTSEFEAVEYELVQMNSNYFLYLPDFAKGHYKVVMNVGYSSVPDALNQLIVEMVAMMYYESKDQTTGLNSVASNNVGISQTQQKKDIYETMDKRLRYWSLNIC